MSRAEINAAANNNNNAEDENELKLAEETESNEMNEVKNIGWKVVYKGNKISNTLALKIVYR